MTSADGPGASHPLDPDLEQWRLWATSTVEYLTGVLRDLPTAPVSDFTGVHALLADPALRRPPPEAGRPLPELLDLLDRAAGAGLNPSSAGYLAFVPGSGLVSTGPAGLVADVLNRYTGLAFPAPALVALEADLLRWLADLFGLPPSGGGILTSGGSLATFSALVTARHDRLPENFLDGTIYVTDQAHHSVAKAVRLAGFPPAAVRIVDTDPALRMDAGALARAVEADRRRGRQPFCVVASAGTTNTGVIDRSPRSPISAHASSCGCTSTGPTAPRSSSPTADGSGSPASSPPTPSCSTRARACSCLSARDAFSSATPRRCARRISAMVRTTCGTLTSSSCPTSPITAPS